MYLGAKTEVRPAHVPIYCDCTVAFALRGTYEFAGGQVFEPIRENVGVCVPEDQRAEFHDRNETRKVDDFGIGVAAVNDAREVKKLSTLIYFGPEALFQSLFSSTHSRGFFDEVKVGEYPDYFWESVSLKDIEEFKCFLPSVKEI